MKNSYDVIVVGGGIAGQIAAIGFARAGFSTCCIDPKPQNTAPNHPNQDLRSTAFLQPAKNFLEHIELWPGLSQFAMPLEKMRIVDAGGAENIARVSCDFAAHEISDGPFGWNVLNRQILAVLADQMQNCTALVYRQGVAATGLIAQDDEIRLKTSQGETLRARLIIGADGRDSQIRRSAGISVRRWRFGQKALAFAVTHPIPHGNVSTEIHRSGGPFTLVPLPDLDGMPASAIVWMDDGPRTLRRQQLESEAFEAEMNTRSCHLLGPLKLITARSIWPIISQMAERLSDQRVALIAEAAHVVPPIGAQGLNMSLGDIQCLLELAQKNPESLGTKAMLDAYEKRRFAQIRTRVLGVSMLNAASQANARPLRDLRSGVLQIMHKTPLIRKTLMRAGMGEILG